MKLCIYCKNDSGDNTPPEHIVPESLGCPSDFVLRHGEVCQRCNNGPLAKLDAELNDTFGLFKVASIPHNKKGKGSAVRVNNLYAENKHGHINIHVNLNKKNIFLDNGKILSPIQKNSYARNGRFDAAGSAAKINFETALIRSKQTVRALHKLAFGALCYFLGREYALQPIFDDVRDFIILGKGNRDMLVQRAVSLPFGPQGHRFDSPKVGINKEYVMPFNFFGIEMMVQLSGAPEKLRELAEKSSGMYSMINSDGLVLPEGQSK